MDNNKQKWLFFSLIFLLGSITILTVGINNHSQIRIDYDSALLKTSATFNDIEIDALATTNTSNTGNWTWAKSIGLCTGSGTSGSPYIIANHIFEYSSGTGNCLTISNSRVYFRIIDCTIRNSAPLHVGLLIDNSTNGDISDCIMYNTLDGIVMLGVNDTQIRDSHIYDNDEMGIVLVNSFHNTITNNNVSTNIASGIVLVTSMHNTISNNTHGFNHDGSHTFGTKNKPTVLLRTKGILLHRGISGSS